MCVHYLWVSIGHCNVLQVLQYSDRLQLDFIKVNPGGGGGALELFLTGVCLTKP